MFLIVIITLYYGMLLVSSDKCILEVKMYDSENHLHNQLFIETVSMHNERPIYQRLKQNGDLSALSIYRVFISGIFRNTDIWCISDRVSNVKCTEYTIARSDDMCGYHTIQLDSTDVGNLLPLDLSNSNDFVCTPVEGYFDGDGVVINDRSHRSTDIYDCLAKSRKMDYPYISGITFDSSEESCILYTENVQLFTEIRSNKYSCILSRAINNYILSGEVEVLDNVTQDSCRRQVSYLYPTSLMAIYLNDVCVASNPNDNNKIPELIYSPTAISWFLLPKQYNQCILSYNEGESYYIKSNDVYNSDVVFKAFDVYSGEFIDEQFIYKDDENNWRFGHWHSSSDMTISTENFGCESSSTTSNGNVIQPIDPQHIGSRYVIHGLRPNIKHLIRVNADIQNLTTCVDFFWNHVGGNGVVWQGDTCYVALRISDIEDASTAITVEFRKVVIPAEPRISTSGNIITGTFGSLEECIMEAQNQYPAATATSFLDGICKMQSSDIAFLISTTGRISWFPRRSIHLEPKKNISFSNDTSLEEEVQTSPDIVYLTYTAAIGAAAILFGLFGAMVFGCTRCQKNAEPETNVFDDKLKSKNVLDAIDAKRVFWKASKSNLIVQAGGADLSNDVNNNSKWSKILAQQETGISSIPKSETEDAYSISWVSASEVSIGELDENEQPVDSSVGDALIGRCNASHTRHYDTPYTPHLNASDTPHGDTPETTHLDSPDTPHGDTPETTHLDSPETLHNNTPETTHLDSPETPHNNTPQTPHSNTPQTPHRDIPETPRRDIPEMMK